MISEEMHQGTAPGTVVHALGRWLGLLSTALSTWTGLALAQPNALWMHSAIYDTPRQRMILFGGTPDNATFSNATWGLTLTSTPHWAAVTTVGVPPSGRLGHSAVFDPVRDRMLVFGGRAQSLQGLADVWALSLVSDTWSELQPLGTPPPGRFFHSAIYDAVRDRMVVFGGQAGAGVTFNDVWSLWLSPSPHWQKMSPTGAIPSPRYSHSAIFDPVRDRMLVFGGYGPNNELWALSLEDSTWSFIPPSGTPPPPRYGHSAIYDPVGDRLIVFAGFDVLDYFEDTWQLELGSPIPAWSRIDAAGSEPSRRSFHSAIYESPFQRMVVFGGLQNVIEPTWALSLGAPLRWIPERPAIEVSPPMVQLPVVTVGDTVSIPFTLSNAGLNPLRIDAFQLPAPEFLVSNPSPPDLPWNAAVSETLTLVATVPGSIRDSVVIASNDPLVPRRKLDLEIDVRGLVFSARVVGQPDSVPLGVPLIVVVTPAAGVHAERGMLFYRTAGSSSAFDSLALTPLATDFIAAVPASAVTERGVEYYARIENSSFFATQPTGAPSAFYVQRVASPDAIAAVIPRPTSGPDFLAGKPVEVDVVLPGGAIFDSGVLHFRRGGEETYASLPLMPTPIPGQSFAVIPDSLVGPRGVEYRVEVQTLNRQLQFPTAGSAPAILSIKVQSLVESSGHSGMRYRLLSVPLDLGDAFAGSLDALLTDQLGTYDPVRWRAYLYDPVSSRNVEFSPAEAARFRPVPGRAFWLISRGSHRVDTAPVAGLSTSTASDYAIALDTGWNLIGNPFDFPVAWSEVGGDVASVDEPVAFDPSLGAAGGYAEEAPTVLVPFEGYFVHASQPCTLSVPPHAATSGLERSLGAGPDDLWGARIEARSESSTDGAVVLGLRHGAARGFDRLDSRKPPGLPGAWVRAAIAHGDWGRHSGEYRRDLRPPGGQGETWEIEVRSSTAGEVVTLDLQEIVAGPPGLVVQLIDREQGSSSEWSRGSSVGGSRAAFHHRIVAFGSHPYRLALAAGSEEYLARAGQQEAVPTRTLLDASSPNPFRIATRMRFGLPRATRVTLEIYSVLGERVAVLLDGSNLVPGFHTAIWDGTRSGGGPAPSGVYLARLVAGGESLTKRVVVLR